MAGRRQESELRKSPWAVDRNQAGKEHRSGGCGRQLEEEIDEDAAWAQRGCYGEGAAPEPPALPKPARRRKVAERRPLVLNGRDATLRIYQGSLIVEPLPCSPRVAARYTSDPGMAWPRRVA